LPNRSFELVELLLIAGAKLALEIAGLFKNEIENTSRILKSRPIFSTRIVLPKKALKNELRIGQRRNRLTFFGIGESRRSGARADTSISRNCK
jgi:hypothetical protein